MKVLVFSAFYLPGYKGGGPIKTIKNLFDRVGSEISFDLITGDRDLGDSLPYASVDFDNWNRVGNASVLYVGNNVKGIRKIYYSIRSGGYDCIYLNSFFSVRFSFIPLLMAKFFGVKVILGPRGEFSEGAIAQKNKKKKFYIGVYKFFRLHRGIVFQASSSFELNDITRVLGSEADTFIAEDIGAQEFAADLDLAVEGDLKAVFISRVSPKKNLLGALATLNLVRQPVTFHIYGPIEDQSYWEACLAEMNDLPPHVNAAYMGTLEPQQVVSTLKSYDVFLFPTKGENYGHVITEALCAGVPVLIADTTPWRGLQEQGIGWDLPVSDHTAFAEVLDKLALTPSSDRTEARKRVLGWARRKFTQGDAIEANNAMFKYAYENK